MIHNPQDGKVTCGEQCGLNFLSFITGMMWLGDLGLAIWVIIIIIIITRRSLHCQFVIIALSSFQGSVVVFGAYSTWTYDLKAAAKDDTYCDYTCFMFAFVLLILRWVSNSLKYQSFMPKFDSYVVLFSADHALRHLLRLHEADVQGLPQGSPGQLSLLKAS